MGDPEIDLVSAQAPALSGPARAPLVLEGAEVLQASWELAGTRGVPLLPPGLAPTSPVLLTVVAVRVAAGPLGPVSWAQVRLSCRSGARARALALPSIVSASDESAQLLGAAWGIGGRRAEVRLQRGYDTVRLVTAGLDVSLLDPSPIGAHDVQYVVGLHRVSHGGEERLAQVELDVVPERLERGRPVLHSFDPVAWGDRRLQPSHPVAGTIAVGTITLPVIRFLLHPDLPAHRATEVLGAAG